jgi:hypothetical protein
MLAPPDVRTPPMPLNLAKLVNDILDSAILYIYAHLSAIWIVARHPVRGPRYLAYKNLRNIDHTVSPRAFLFVNLFICFWFVDFASPLIFVFWDGHATEQVVAETLKKIRASQIDFVPTIMRSLVVFTTVYAVFDVATSLFERHPRKRPLIRNSLLFSFGLQPLAVIVAFLYATRFDLFNSTHETFILVSTLALLALITVPAVAFAIKTFRARDALGGQIHAGIVATIFVVVVYTQGIALASWDPFAKETRLVVTKLSCGWAPSGDIVVEAFIDNLTNDKQIIPLQTDQSDYVVWADGKSVEPRAFDSSAGPGAPYLVLAPGASGWFRLKGQLPPASAKPSDCSLTFQKDLSSGKAAWHKT